MKYSLEHIREVFFWSLEARDMEMLRYLLHPSFNFCLKGEVITYSEFLMRIEKRRFLFLQNFSAKSAIALPVKKNSQFGFIFIRNRKLPKALESASHNLSYLEIWSIPNDHYRMHSLYFS